MATKTVSGEPNVGTRGGGLTSNHVWKTLAKASFAVLGHVTPIGRGHVPAGSSTRPSAGGLYVAVAPDSWKARHIEATGRVAVTVLVAVADPVARLPHPHRRPSASTRRRSCTRPACRTTFDPRQAGLPASGREARLRLHHRDRPRRHLRDVRHRGAVDEDAGPDSRPGARAGLGPWLRGSRRATHRPRDQHHDRGNGGERNGAIDQEGRRGMRRRSALFTLPFLIVGLILERGLSIPVPHRRRIDRTFVRSPSSC